MNLLPGDGAQDIGPGLGFCLFRRIWANHPDVDKENSLRYQIKVGILHMKKRRTARGRGGQIGSGNERGSRR